MLCSAVASYIMKTTHICRLRNVLNVNRTVKTSVKNLYVLHAQMWAHFDSYIILYTHAMFKNFHFLDYNIAMISCVAASSWVFGYPIKVVIIMIVPYSE